MQQKRYLLLLWVFCTMLPLVSPAQPRPWKRTITLKDRLEGGQTPDVAKVTLSAYFLVSRVSPGAPIMRAPDGTTEIVTFNKRPDGYIKFRFEDITWMLEQLKNQDVESVADLTPEFKVVVRSLWVDMAPSIYLDQKRANPGMAPSRLRRMYITAPNVEYIYGDSMPPPIIFKVDQNADYKFLIGIKAVTPETGREKQFVFTFDFSVRGLIKDHKSLAPEEPEEVAPPPIVVVDTAPKVDEPEPEQDTREIDAAVQRAIEEENADALISLMRDHPDVQSVKDARPYLAIQMRRELIDSITYRVDINYEKFTRSLPRRSQIGLGFKLNGRDLPQSAYPYYQWKEDKLYVTPPRDTQDYTVTAQHLQAREHRAQTTLNSVRDFINLTYRDTLDGEYISLRVTGGKRPFMLHLEQKKALDFFAMDGAMKIYGDTLLRKTRVARSFGLTEEADYRIFVEDSDQLKKTGVNVIHITPPPPIPVEVWYASAGGLFLFLIGFLFWRREQRRKDEEMEKLLAARGGKDPRVKRKPKPNLRSFWMETAISDMSLHKNFIREMSTYLRERPGMDHGDGVIEGVILGTVIKFDFENEQYEIRLDRFRALPARALDFYDDKPNLEKWGELREVTEHHRDLVRIGWLQIVQNEGDLTLTDQEVAFQDEQFSELFQLMVKIDISGNQRETAFFTRTTAGKMNNVNDRRNPAEGWMDWDRLEDAGYYENMQKPIRNSGGDVLNTPAPQIDAGLNPGRV
ncbi:MAG: hypothetical protein AAGN35_19050 [Bacteroidota bacterium]